VTPLARLTVGASGRIAYIASRSHARLDRLAALGIVPGTEVRLHQRKPSYLVFLGETQIALDEETAREIYVRPDPA
jgi:DtxR family Mn-dependent transcriptional regulator